MMTLLLLFVALGLSLPLGNNCLSYDKKWTHFWNYPSYDVSDPSDTASVNQDPAYIKLQNLMRYAFAGEKRSAQKRAYYWPGMWRFASDYKKKKDMEKRRYYMPSFAFDYDTYKTDSNDEISPPARLHSRYISTNSQPFGSYIKYKKRAYYWPTMWNFRNYEKKQTGGYSDDTSSDYGKFHPRYYSNDLSKKSYYWPSSRRLYRPRSFNEYSGQLVDDADMKKRAYYWPGMWRYNRGYDTYNDESYDDNKRKRAYYWPGMWRHTDRFNGKRYDDASDFAEKRATYWPGMWRSVQDDEAAGEFRKRGYYWPGMWRHVRKSD